MKKADCNAPTTIESVVPNTRRYEIRCSKLHTIYIDEAVYHADIYGGGQVQMMLSRPTQVNRAHSPANRCRLGCLWDSFARAMGTCYERGYAPRHRLVKIYTISCLFARICTIDQAQFSCVFRRAVSTELLQVFPGRSPSTSTPREGRDLSHPPHKESALTPDLLDGRLLSVPVTN